MAGLGDAPLLIQDALRRLRADGEGQPRDRQRVGAAMLRLLAVADQAAAPLPAEDDAPLWHLQAALWAGQVSEALEHLDLRLAAVAGPAEAALLQRAARWLGDSAEPRAQRRAVACWNQLAAGMPSGSDAWHRAKLAAARQLVQLGERGEAQQLVQFVLITRPPQDPELRREYEALLP